MSTSQITIDIDPEAARVYDAATLEEKRKLQLLLKLRLRELMAGPPRPLAQIMDEIGAFAQERGLTPEILESLLREN